MNDEVFYPISAMNTMLHIISINSSRTLCGITPNIYWEMSFEGQVFPEIGEFVERHQITLSEGFYIGSWFAPEVLFCKMCYKKIKTK